MLVLRNGKGQFISIHDREYYYQEDISKACKFRTIQDAVDVVHNYKVVDMNDIELLEEKNI